MGFFKLGKLDKGEKKEGKEKDKKSRAVEESTPTSTSGPSVNDFISKTKSRQKQGLKPSGPELIAYARYLGIDPVVDHDLLWIAEEALAAPLPSEWTEHFDSSDRVFYYNATSHVSSWTHPLEQVYRDTYRTVVQFRGSAMSSQERVETLHTLQNEVHTMEKEVHQEITAWTEHADDQGHRFYFNRVKGKSSWTDPRPAKCHILYLKMKTIRILCQHAGVNMMDQKLVSRFEPLTPDEKDERQSKRSRTDKVRDGSEDPSDQRSRGRRRDPLERDEDPDAHRHDNLAGDMAAPLWSGNEARLFASEGPQKKKKKKKKKKDKEEGHLSSIAGADVLLHSQSEPAASFGRARPPDDFGLGPGFDEDQSYDSGPNRQRVKAGIRLEPLGGGGASGVRLEPLDPRGLSHAGAGAAGLMGVPLHSSLSVPALP